MSTTSVRSASAQTAGTQTFWNRVSVDVGYELSYVYGLYTPSVYSTNPATGRQVSALLFLRYRSISQGIGADSTIAIRPWLALGIEAHLQQDFTAPTHPWFETLGIRYGRRKALTLGPFIEFRPLQREYLPRKGLFFRAGVRTIWFDRELSRTEDVISPTNGHGQEARFWLGGGYRLVVTSVVSVFIMADVARGLDADEARLRIGGGFQ